MWNVFLRLFLFDNRTDRCESSRHEIQSLSPSQLNWTATSRNSQRVRTTPLNPLCSSMLLWSASFNMSHSVWHMKHLEIQRETPPLLLHLIQVTFPSLLPPFVISHTQHAVSFTLPLSSHANTLAECWLSLAASLYRNVRRYKPEGIHHQRRLDTLPPKDLHADTSDEWRLVGEIKKVKKL